MLHIDIASDIVCPWCFIGLRRFAEAEALVRQEIPDFAVRKRWLPFFLNPDTPPAGEPYLPFLVAKFGSRERVDALFAQIRAAGAAHGADFHFEKIQVRASTLDAHRLIHHTQQQGIDAAPLVERLFMAQFQQGLNVGDRAVLLQVARDAGLEPPGLEAWLASDADVDAVRALEGEVRRIGIRSVPTYLVDQRFAVVGAEEPATLAEALGRAWRNRQG
ncbi:DsbA family oxidoreductase [Zoogloea sp.]|uniref:DsbA family oxidoreductase n=1 Tax=Zoogloea sp. TaxID=49181 RepID=UPI001416DFC7|nr:MAG: DsbA family oxidoreductase [Zoogloea sp.]